MQIVDNILFFGHTKRQSWYFSYGLILVLTILLTLFGSSYNVVFK